MGERAQRLARELRALYAAAGSPRVSEIVMHDAKQKQPAKFNDATISDWLRGESVPSPGSQAFAVLTMLLEREAGKRPGYVPRSAIEWEQLRAAAQAERRVADQGPCETPPPDADSDSPGVPIGQCDPLDLEVHPAGDGVGRDAASRLPGYVRRAHDEQLAVVVARAAAGRSAMAVLVGSSSTGKTRACWEAVQPLASAEPGWRLWHPVDPTRVEAALAGIEAVRPHTVVWLNEAQHYLVAGERLAAAVHRLLTDPARAPVLVLGTLWPNYDRAYAVLAGPGGSDPHSRARELLAGRRIEVPDTFDNLALARARELAEGGDQVLSAVLGRGHLGRVAQYLAGAPELLARYHSASPPARALLDAAADARRLGVGLHLPLAFLADAAAGLGYLDQDVYDTLDEDWLEQALAELARPVHGNLAPLRRIRRTSDHRPPGPTPALPPKPTATGPAYRLADYLEQHLGQKRRFLCPPASFWHAAHQHLTDAEDLELLASGALHRYRLQWADALYQRAAQAGHRFGLMHRAELRDRIGDHDGAEALYLQAADAGHIYALSELVERRERAGDYDGAEAFARRGVDAGSSFALSKLVGLRERAGDYDGAEAFARQAAADGDTTVLVSLIVMREQAGDRDGAEALCLRAVDAGHTFALISLADLRERAGDCDGAEALYRQAADAGHTSALISLADLRERIGDYDGAKAFARRAAAEHAVALPMVARLQVRSGDRDGAEALARQAAASGDTSVLISLAELQERAEDYGGAEALYRQAVNAGDTSAMISLAELQERAEDYGGAEALYRQAVNAGDTSALRSLAILRERAGDRDEAEAFVWRAVAAGFASALLLVADLRERAGDWDGAETLYRQATDVEYSSSSVLSRLAHLRERAGDWDGAETLYRQALDGGSSPALTSLVKIWTQAGHDDVEALERYGLDPDGKAVSAWA